MQSPRSDIYFLHIPKTAGTSLAGMIRRSYAPEESIPAFHWHELARMKRAEVNRYRCFTGHFGISLYSLLDHDVPTITLLRDPFERTVSHFKYSQRIDGGLQGQALRNILSTSEQSGFSCLRSLYSRCYHRYEEEGLRDCQTRHLGIEIDLQRQRSLPNPMTRGLSYEQLMYRTGRKQPMEAIFERAKRHLDSMVVVGTVERFAESTALIYDHLGIPVPEALPQENISPGHAVGSRYRDSGEFSPQFIERIDSITQYDRALYAYANQLLDRQLADRNAIQKEYT